MNQKPPCADPKAEELYVRSCILGAVSYSAHLYDDEKRLSPDDCYADAHAEILRAVWALVDAKQRPYPREVSVRCARGAQEALERILQPASDIQPPAVLAEDLRVMAANRRMLREVNLAAASLIDGNRDAALEHLLSVRAESAESREQEFMQAAQTVEHARAVARESKNDKLRTGFAVIDRDIGPMREQTLTVLGGTTGSGKSSLMLAMAVQQAQRGVRVGIVSVEDAASVWGPRVLSHVSDVNPTSWDRPRDEWFAKQSDSGITICRDYPLHFAFELGRPLNDVLRAIRHLARRYACQVIYVDYLQAIRDPQSTERRHFIANAAARIKSQCQELGVACVLGSQLARPGNGKQFEEVFTSALKESGDIENMAEVILLLWKTSDEGDAKTLGKVAKVKWSPGRARFEVERNPQTGCVVALAGQAASTANAGWR